MAWYFRNGRLESPTNSWPAVSGPHGNGALPRGEYRIGKVTGIGANRFYTDRNGFTWWCPITPTFALPAGRSGGFGIHPDGDDPGTHGCIGLTNADTRSTFNALKNAQDESLIVE